MSLHLQTVTATSPATPSTATLGTFSGLARYTSGTFVATLTGATGGNLDVYLQVWDGANWIDYAHFPQKTAGSGATIVALPVTRNYQRVATVATGVDTPALAADVCLGGDFGDVVRVRAVAGAATSAGASQTVRFFATQPT